jgi:EKC/KEOPS complex subunit PCC1/LAGE3
MINRSSHTRCMYCQDASSGLKLTHPRTIDVPFPNERLANAALRTLSVDEELSQLVRRSFSLIPSTSSNNQPNSSTDSNRSLVNDSKSTVRSTGAEGVWISYLTSPQKTLRVYYEATTPRMLRVSVNGFFESLSVIVQIMEELDIDVLHEDGLEGLEGVQGVEQGLTGNAGTLP